MIISFLGIFKNYLNKGGKVVIDFIEMKKAVEELTDNKNTVIFDNMNMPSVVVKIPKMTSAELYEGGANTTHPAFITGTGAQQKEYQIVGFSKFLNTIINGRAYSLPLAVPAVNVNYIQAIDACRAKGGIWGLVPDALWAVVSYLTIKNDTIPHGNTNYGQYNSTTEQGLPAFHKNNQVGTTLTGSGPNTWSSTGDALGIYDMCGNAHCLVGGSRLRNGMLNFIPNATSVLPTTDISADSTEWKNIAQDGTFEDYAGNSVTALGFAWDTTNNIWVLRNNIPGRTSAMKPSSSKACAFADFAIDNITVPAYLYDLARMPVASLSSSYGDCRNSMNVSGGEYIPVRGGGYDNGVNAHIFRCDNSDRRTYKYSAEGFFSAYYGTF